MSTAQLALMGGPKTRIEMPGTWPVSGKEERDALLAVLESDAWGRLSGSVTATVEHKLAVMLGVRYVICLNSGQTALRLAVLALNPPAGSEIICPAYTFIATAMAIIEANCVPVFADIEPGTLCLDAKSVASHITPKTVAIMPVHLAGIPTDMDALCALADKHHIAIIEDASHAHLSTWHNRPVGSIGNVGCFSLQASKNLNCGEGGFITTNDPDLYRRISAIQNNGRIPDDPQRYRHATLGGNYRMTEFQAAILGAQLTRLPAQTSLRHANGKRLNRCLSGIDGFHPKVDRVAETCNAYHLYCFEIDLVYFDVNRFLVLDALRAEGIACGPGYATLVYEHDAFRNKDFGPYSAASEGYNASVCQNDAQCPVSVHIGHHVGAWLPMTELNTDTAGIEVIVDAFRKVSAGSEQLRKA